MIDKSYNPKQIENDWYAAWEKNGYFAPHSKNQSYCIMIPPPNVTGSLHMGHAFQQTLMDILIRYHRMLGDNTLWQVGTDHAGIATQMIVERQLIALGHDRHQLGREAFIHKIWEWKALSGNNITKQLRRIGASVDWNREKFTLDESLSKAVQEVFISLYQEGLIYRGKRLVNWDPVLGTAVSDLEVELNDESGLLWTIQYPLVDEHDQIIPKQFIQVATTRPETLLGDVAVAVHPDDERYHQWIGKKVKLPLTDRTIPIIADKEVVQDFGSGAVKITPAHDFNDYLIGERHKLPKINIFNKDATLNENVPSKYQKMDRVLARKEVLKDLKKEQFLVKEEPYTLRVPRGDRSGAILEPLLTDQWFVKMEPLAKPAIEAVEKGDIRFVPDNWRKTYFEWLNNIQDWCISRQIWWGHRIPAWYDEQGNIYVGRSIDEIRQTHHLSKDLALHQDEDVLDTWFSSALWPFSTLGWPEKTEDFETFYPTQVLITGFDIIFFWVARMVMFGLKFAKKIPFHEVYINGLILDQDGQKMSKTKGNVIDPLDIIDGIDLESLVQKRKSGLMQPQLAEKIEKLTRVQFPKGIDAHGVDALRFNFASIATQARHIRFDLNRVEGYRHFCNKIWNAARYVLMNTEGKVQNNKDHNIILKKANLKDYALADRWIITLWQQVKKELKTHLETYRFDLASKALYEFIWNEYCDWYLELSKPVLTEQNAFSKEVIEGTKTTLYTLLEEWLRALHPFMPYITETLWHEIKTVTHKKSDTIMLEPYPSFDPLQMDESTLEEIQWIKAFILGIRTIRAEMNISPSKPLPVLLSHGNDKDRRRVKEYFFLKNLVKIESIQWLENHEKKPSAATALVDELEILIPMENLIDKEAEIIRLKKETDKLGKDLEKLNQKLLNPNFVKNAPSEVVSQDKKRVADLSNAVKKLNERLQELEKL